jgi:SAM-dependent methyltransferase
MAIDTATAQFLVAAKRAGVAFDRTLTLGRQHLHVPQWLVDQITEEFEVAAPEADDDEAWRFADPLLRMLGAGVIDAIDASDFEGATIVHDMNKPIDAQHHEQYDVVVDGGTLEHVFHFPTAIANCMHLVKPGGHLIVLSPANNYCGHGFYQFSPELWFRVLCPENGFAVRRMVAVEAFALGRWHEVTDPVIVGRRVELVGAHRVQIFTLARRDKVVPVCEHLPQQSDYESAWDAQADESLRARPATARRKRFKRRIEHAVRKVAPWLAYTIRKWADRRVSRKCSFDRQARAYRRVRAGEPRD